MVNCKKELHKVVATGWGPLFDNPLSEGALDVSLAFRDALSKALSRCKESRYQIAGKLSELTRRNISKDSLDKYTSSNPDYGLRAEDLPGVLIITQSLEPIQALLDPIGCSVASPEDSRLLKLARLTQQKNHIALEIARLEAQLGMKTR